MLRANLSLSLLVLIGILFSALCFSQTTPADPPKPHPEVLALLGKGYQSSQEHKYSDSLRFYEEALAKARVLQDRIGEGEALHNIGNIHLSTGNPRKALPFYEQALPLRREGGFKYNEATTLNNLGYAYEITSQMQKAMEHYEQALTLFRQIGDKKGEADALEHIGVVYAKTGQLDKALTNFEQQMVFAKQAGDVRGEAGAFVNIGNIHRMRGQARQAQQSQEQALRLYRQVGDKLGEARALGNLGNVCAFLGDLQQALDYYEQGLTLEKQLGDRHGEAMTLNNIGNIYRVLGPLQRALQYYELVLPFFKEIGDKNGEARVLNNIGTAYLAMGQPQKALQYYGQVLSLDRQTANRREEAATLANIGTAYTELNLPQKALQYYEPSLRIRKEIGDKGGEASTLNSMGLAHYAMGQLQKALACYEKTLPLERELENRGGEGAVLHNIGNVYYATNQLQKALQYYNQALPIHQQVGNIEYQGNTLINMGHVYTGMRKPKEARDCFQRALQLRESYRRNIGYSPTSKLTYLSKILNEYQRYIALLVQQDQTSDAFAWTQKVKARVLLDLMQSGRINLTHHLTPEEQRQERELRQHADALNARMVAESVGNTEGARKQFEALREELKKVESEWQTFTDRLFARYPDLALQRAARTATLTEIARFLPEDTALLEYVCLRDTQELSPKKTLPPLDKLLLMVVTQHRGQAQVVVHTLPGKSKTQSVQIEAFRKACADPTRDWKERARSLYATLVAPAEKSFQGKKQLIICPDGPLWDVPFAALMSARRVSGVGYRVSEARNTERMGKRGRGQGKSASDTRYPTPDTPLMERFAITYAYSATGAIAAAKAFRDPQRPKPTKTLLAMTNPAFGGAGRFENDNKTFSPRPLDAPSRPLEAPSRVLDNLLRDGKIVELPGTQREAEALKRDFPEATILNREKAQETIFKRSAAEYRYLHLATHGFTNDAAPLLSSLVLAEPTKDSKDDGLLTAREITELALRAELVVLSACNTGRGERKAGEGVIGLTWALFVAGCPSSVVSQWSVSDRSTAQLMANFYQNLKKGQKKGAALRAAALQLRQATTTQHPYYWAPFVLVGEGN